MNDVDSIAHIVETYSKQPQYLRAYMFIYIIVWLSMSYNNVTLS
jgi:hypothetical protein